MGYYSGRGNNSGNFNVFLGDSAAAFNSSGSFNTIVGARAATGTNSLNNAIAIGHLSQVDASNSMVLGSINGVNGAVSDVKVGIGTTAPTYKLHVSNGNAGGGGIFEGILVENTVVPPGNIGEAAISFKNYATGDSTWMIGLNETNHLSFALGTTLTGPTTKMFLSADGDLGVGTVTPAAKLDVAGTSVLGVNGTALTEIIKVTLSKDIASIAANGTAIETFAVVNSQLGSSVHISPGAALPSGLVIAYARVSAAGTVEVKFTNTTGGIIDPSIANFYITVIR